MVLENKIPKTIFSQDTPVMVKDSNNNMFYYHPNTRGSILFNLPKGTFYTTNKLIEQPFNPYEKFEPKNLKFRPSDFTTVLKPNPNKATINTFFKTITVDPNLMKLNYQPVVDFCIGHELGHLEVGGNTYDNDGKIIFDAEKECDRIATNYMLSHGWNPTQINIAKELLLRSQYRKDCIHNNTVGKYNLR